MKNRLFYMVLRKSGIVLVVSSLIVLAMGMLSTGGWTYAGFAAAFLGAVYLLNAWVKFMHSRNRRVLPRFKLPAKQQAPYFHRNEKTDRPGIRSIGYRFDDSLEDEADDFTEYGVEYGSEDFAVDGVEHGVEDEHEGFAKDGTLDGSDGKTKIGNSTPNIMRLKAESAAYAVCGVVLLVASLFIQG